MRQGASLDRTGAAGRLQRSGKPPRVLVLNGAQLALVMTAAGSLPVEKRSVFLARVPARLLLPALHRCRSRRRDTGRTDRLIQSAA